MTWTLPEPTLTTPFAELDLPRGSAAELRNRAGPGNGPAHR